MMSVTSDLKTNKEVISMGDYIIPIFWAVAFIALLVAEAQTAELVAVWFLPGTLIALILSLFSVPLWIQLLVFIVLSTLFLALGLCIFRKRLLKKVGSEKTDTDLLIGCEARVEEEIVNGEERGAVRIDGKTWSARMVNDAETASPGEYVTVVKISGVKLICKKR